VETEQAITNVHQKISACTTRACTEDRWAL